MTALPRTAARALLLLTLLPLTPPADAFERKSYAWLKTDVALRNETRVGNNVVGQAAAGSEVRLLVDDVNAYGRWWYVESGALKGWVLESKLQPVTPASPSAPAEVTAAEPARAAGSGEPIAPADRGAEIAAVRARLADPRSDTRALACRSLGYSGITDEALFDEIERRVLAGYQGSALDRDREQEMSWCAKALAYSGRSKYRPTLERIAAYRRAMHLSRHAETALAWLDDFARWNGIINDTANHRPGQSWQVTRAMNELKSGEPELRKEGLRAIKELPGDRTPLYDIVEARLLADHQRRLDEMDEDVAAWHARALADSGNPKYRATLARVATEGSSAKLRKHAQSSLKRLGERPRG